MCAEPGKRVSGRRREAGFTLVELGVGLMIAGAAALGLGYVFALDYGIWVRGPAKLAMHAGANRALDGIAAAAAHASDFSVPAPGQLRLAFPVPPIGDSIAADTTFRWVDGRLERDGKTVMPLVSDSGWSVAAFDPRIEVEPGTGIRTLSLRLSVLLVTRADIPADTFHFQTTVHARNLGMGTTASGSGQAASGNGAGGYVQGSDFF